MWGFKNIGLGKSVKHVEFRKKTVSGGTKTFPSVYESFLTEKSIFFIDIKICKYIPILSNSISSEGEKIFSHTFETRKSIRKEYALEVEAQFRCFKQ